MEQPNATASTLLDTKQLAAALNVTVAKIQDACKTGKLRPTIVLGRDRRFDLADAMAQLRPDA